MKTLKIRPLIVMTVLSIAGAAQAADKKVNNSNATDTDKGFEVTDLPKPEPIEGQLGEPGAPSLAESQQKLAKAMLEKGICNENYYGEEFCKKQLQRSFRVTDQIRMEYSAVGSESRSE